MSLAGIRERETISRRLKDTNPSLPFLDSLRGGAQTIGIRLGCGGCAQLPMVPCKVQDLASAEIPVAGDFSMRGRKKALNKKICRGATT